MSRSHSVSLAGDVWTPVPANPVVAASPLLPEIHLWSRVAPNCICCRSDCLPLPLTCPPPPRPLPTAHQRQPSGAPWRPLAARRSAVGPCSAGQGAVAGPAAPPALPALQLGPPAGARAPPGPCPHLPELGSDLVAALAGLQGGAGGQLAAAGQLAASGAGAAPAGSRVPAARPAVIQTGPDQPQGPPHLDVNNLTHIVQTTAAGGEGRLVDGLGLLCGGQRQASRVPQHPFEAGSCGRLHGQPARAPWSGAVPAQLT